jgi:hypothetical protein
MMLKGHKNTIATAAEANPRRSELCCWQPRVLAAFELIPNSLATSLLLSGKEQSVARDKYIGAGKLFSHRQ